MAASTPIASGTDAAPTTRAAAERFANISPTQTSFATASAAERRTDHAPASLPETTPAAAEPHVAKESTISTTPVSVKKPRLTPFHSGVTTRSTRPPATVSARTSAVTPAGPEIGRAPCRERVAQCVYIPLGADEIKKKQDSI